MNVHIITIYFITCLLILPSKVPSYEGNKIMVRTFTILINIPYFMKVVVWAFSTDGPFVQILDHAMCILVYYY